MSTVSQFDQPAFRAPIRWSVRVLAWLAFAVSAYLAWIAASHSSAAGCGVNDAGGCDLVLTSGWSKWLGLPVALGGLACYASLAGLSVLMGVRDPRAVRCVTTLLLMLSVLAAGAAIWFTGVQVLVLESLCRYCLFVHSCGIAIAGLVCAAVIQRRESQQTATGMSALQMALPGAPRLGQVPTVRRPELHSPAPSLGIALGGAATVLALLVMGQLIFPSPSTHSEKVVLQDSINLVGSTPPDTNAEAVSANDSQEHIAMRIPTDAGSDDPGVVTADGENSASDPPTSDIQQTSATEEPGTTSPPPPVASPKRERIVTFLGGKLKLNVYDHPVLGNPEAPHIMIEMVSYDCMHCRKMHRTVQRGLKRYGDQMAVLLMVVPMEKKCNKLVTDPKASHAGACTIARMAVGVGLLNPPAFRGFHDWLMSGKDKPPSQEKVIIKGRTLVDRDRWHELSNGNALNKQIGQYIDLFATLRNRPTSSTKTFGLPIQIMGDEVMTGGADDADEVYREWEKHLGVKPI